MSSIKLYESLFIMHKCNLTINRLWNIIAKSQNDIDKIEDYALLFSYYIKLESISFLDEYNDAFLHNIEDEFKPRMKELRLLNSPIIKRIKKWKDLEKFRNSIIAHPWRYKGQFVIPDQKFFDIPRNWFEVGVLVNLMNYVWQLSKAEFNKELDEALIYIASLQTHEEVTVNYSDLNNDHLKMAAEVGEICNTQNKSYYLKVLNYKFAEEI